MTSLTTSLLLAVVCASPGSGTIDLSGASIVTRGEAASAVEKTAATVLVEEARKRTGIEWKTRTDAPAAGAVIVVTTKLDGPAIGAEPSAAVRTRAAGLKAEGFVLAVDTTKGGQPIVWIIGHDPRGALFGVGKLLRVMDMAKGSALLDARTNLVTSPAYPIRGHQLGYRNRANSWDAWDVAQFDQYIRELAIFGANCVENIPFEDSTPGVHMKLSRDEMNVKMSEICDRYDQDYWLWTPADFDLTDTARRAKALKEHEALYKACPRLDAVFFPGGDPGDNPAKLVLPFLEDVAVPLVKHHPKAKVWLSLQAFSRADAEMVYKYLDDKQPDWFGGIVYGPSSPPLQPTRKRLNPKYPIRSYPDITHNVRCQFPIPWWDPALAFTLGREAINPRPLQYQAIHNALAPYTAGFLSYSDGVHDDVNKVVWNLLAWDPETPVRQILVEYANFFFASNVAEQAADGILALEKNWIGALRDNGGVDGTLAIWDGLEKKAPQLAGNWRWQMCLLRAVYDAYTRHRLIVETAQEEEALAKLAEIPPGRTQAAMDDALAALKRAETAPARPDLRMRIDELSEALYRSIALQSSMTKHKASGAERGCFLDFVDYPLNNRWWLEDRFSTIGKLLSEDEKIAKLETLRTWEHPGPGSFYDSVGDVARAPHVVVGDISNVGESLAHTPIPEILWWEDGKSRKKPAWMCIMNWPSAMRYTGLDPKGDYMIRTTGNRECRLSIDGERIKPTLDNQGVGQFKEFPVPKKHLADREITLTFERPSEPHLNWRVQSRLSELWLIKK
jgi:hypothetical protein